MWIASVENIDFPSRTGLSVAEQKKEFEAWLDLAVRLNLNTVISQVRPAADAFWPSPYEPWSRYLTGTQGKDPGYDVLAFQVEAAHERGLELHAWFNPYRVSNDADASKLVPHHPARVHPDWVLTYGGKLYYDPGLPAVRAFVQDAMLDAVRRYDIDAVHFDDYFYPYPVAGQSFPDDASYAASGTTLSRADWRRENVNLLVREMRDRIRETKANVKFGISPFGIWRNSSSDPSGSATKGSESYSAISADTRRWVTEGWVDYICPQVYWKIGHPLADYQELSHWWARTVEGTGVALYIGQAAYQVTSGVFDDRELIRHLDVDAASPRVDGAAYFSASDLRADPHGAISALVRERYARPALVPALPSGRGGRPGPAYALSARRDGDDVVLHWRITPGTVRCAIWRLPDADVTPERLDDAANLVAIVHDLRPGAPQSFTVRDASPGGFYVVTPYDRLGNEGRHSLPRSA